MPEEDTTHQQLVASSVKGVGYLMGLQLVSKVFTFVLNILIVRQVSPELFAIASIHQPLLLSVIFLLSREGFRRATARCTFLPPSSPSELQEESKEGRKKEGEGTKAEGEGMKIARGELVWMIWSVVPIGCVLSVLSIFLFYFYQSEEETRVDHYPLFLILIGSFSFCYLHQH